jgi:hypothetical protein
LHTHHGKKRLFMRTNDVTALRAHYDVDFRSLDCKK